MVLGPLTLHLPAGMNALADAAADLSDRPGCPLIQSSDRITLSPADLDAKALAGLDYVELNTFQSGNPALIRAFWPNPTVAQVDPGIFQPVPAGGASDSMDRWAPVSPNVSLQCGRLLPGQSGRFCGWRLYLTPEVEVFGGFQLANLPPSQWQAMIKAVPVALSRPAPDSRPLPLTLPADEATAAGCPPG